MSDNIIPGAVTVAVTSGKGGVGKTTTTVALAAALAARGIDVIVLDGDIDGPNVHLVAEVPDTTLGVNLDQLSLTLPTSPLGFRVATPVSLPSERASTSDLIGMARFAAPCQVVLVDLPPGWTKHHEAVCGTLPDLVIGVVAPTQTALSDHARHVNEWGTTWRGHVGRLTQRQKQSVPSGPSIVAVETMARFTGVPETGGDPVTVRRLDALPAQEVAGAVRPVVSIPATATAAQAADLPEVGQLADRVLGLLPADAEHAS